MRRRGNPATHPLGKHSRVPYDSFYGRMAESILLTPLACVGRDAGVAIYAFSGYPRVALL